MNCIEIVMGIILLVAIVRFLMTSKKDYSMYRNDKYNEKYLLETYDNEDGEYEYEEDDEEYEDDGDYSQYYQNGEIDLSPSGAKIDIKFTPTILR